MPLLSHLAFAAGQGLHLPTHRPPAFISSCPPQGRFPLAQAIHRRDPGLETAAYLVNVGLNLHRPRHAEIPDNPMFNMKPNSLIYGARYDRNDGRLGLRVGAAPVARAFLSGTRST